MIYIGIDPGRSTGICLYDPHRQKIVDLQTMDFWDTIRFISRYRKSQTEFKVVIENPGLNKPTFFKDLKSEAVKMKKSQDVGRNKEDAWLIIQYCIKYSVHFTEVKPVNSKWNHDFFARVTKFDKKKTTNEHERDAARLVWGL